MSDWLKKTKMEGRKKKLFKKSLNTK